MNNFSDRFKILRTDKGLSQHELSAKLDIPRTTISSWELGRRSPDIETLKSLANYFDVSTDYLLGRSSERNPVHIKTAINDLYDAIKDDINLIDFIEKLTSNRELQTVSKEIKDLSAPTLITLSRIAKVLEADNNELK